MFVYRARDRAGQEIKGVIEADQLQAAVARLREKGYIITEIKEQGIKGLTLDLEIGKKGISRKELANFCRQFAVMLKSGLTVMQALHVFLREGSKRRLREGVRDIIQDLERGKSLSEAMARHPHLFPSLLVNMVEAGEAGGILDQVFERMAAYYQREHELRSKILNSMIYPAIVAVLSIVVANVLVLFVLPRFLELFAGQEEMLPLTTKIIIASVNFLQNYYLYLLIGVIIVVALIARFLRTDYGKSLKDRLSLTLPLIRTVNKKILISRFTRTMGTLLSCGVPLMQAFDIVKKVIHNRVMVAGLERAQNSIREGRSISDPLGETGIFPPMVLQMIAVGEESGSLEQMMERVAAIYDYEVEQTLSRLTSLIEPAMIVFVALIVGLVVISIIAPMYQMISTIG